jgi:serine/threonine-protein kinase
MNEVQVGQTLDDRFKIVNIVTRSGMASIYEAIDCDTGKSVAIKVPFIQFESDPAFYSRFLREEEIGKVLQHPGILHVIPIEREKSRPYIAMEYLKGRTLAQLLRCVRPLPVKDALRIASMICDALAYMHRPELNVIHRDIKPDNIMLCNDGTLRIMDFGIAKAELRSVTLGGLPSSAIGTPDYMAPEQVKGHRVDARTDLYALGALLYEMTTGKVPFQGDNIYTIMNARLVGDPIAPRQLNPGIPPEVEEIILHAMERNPEDRYQSASEMKAELDNLDSVKLTGRYLHLNTPKVWRIWLRILRPFIIGVVIPILSFVGLYLYSRRH